jgi:dienelactone hydrolase
VIKRRTLAVLASVAGLMLSAVVVPTAAQAVPPGSDLSAAGPYAKAFVTQTISANGRSFSADIRYPGAVAGNGAAAATGQFPVVAFGHGWLQATSTYTNYMDHLASWGVIVVAPRTQTGLFPNHSAFADDLNAALAWAVAQNTTAGSRFEGRVRTDKLGLSGHSMGGGAAVVAASRNTTNIDAVGTFQAAVTNSPSATTQAALVTAPALWVAGSSDSTASVSGHQRPMYNAKLPSKQLRIVTGGGHTAGQNSSSAAAQDMNELLLTRWFLYYLTDDTTLEDAVWGATAQATAGVSFEAVR